MRPRRPGQAGRPPGAQQEPPRAGRAGVRPDRGRVDQAADGARQCGESAQIQPHPDVQRETSGWHGDDVDDFVDRQRERSEPGGEQSDCRRPAPRSQMPRAEYHDDGEHAAEHPARGRDRFRPRSRARTIRRAPRRSWPRVRTHRTPTGPARPVRRRARKRCARNLTPVVAPRPPADAARSASARPPSVGA